MKKPFKFFFNQNKQKTFLKIIVCLLLIFFNNYDDSTFLMEKTLEQKSLDSDDSDDSKLKKIFKNEKVLIGLSVIILILSITIAIFFTAEIDKILWEIQSITTTQFYEHIKSIKNLIDIDSSFKNSGIKVLENLIKDKCLKEKTTDSAKLEKLIKDLIEEIQKKD